jgi:aryl-alcohol dehydrogenase-like predicted oxidoreductase
MGMSDLYGPADRLESIATIHAALDAGIKLLDTGDFYGMGHNEMLIREALAGRPRESVQISGHWSKDRQGDKDFRSLDAIVPPNAAAGERYSPAQMAHLDSEMG